jgi:hypothetical protein
MSKRFIYYGSFASVQFFSDLFGMPAAAYSLRKLTPSATNCIRVRRSSDNTEQDIGFVANVPNSPIDTTALLAFVGAGNGLVTAWYDQSTSAINANQTSAGNQPQIVSSGVVVTEGGLPALLFDGTNDVLISTNVNLLNNKSNHAIFSANRSTLLTLSGRAVIDITFRSSINTRMWIAQSRLTALRYETGGRRLTADTFQAIQSNANNSAFTLISSLGDYATTNLELYQGSVLVASSNSFQTSGNTNASNSDIFIGNNQALSRPWQGYVSETIIYESNQSTNRTGIETNISTYYGI